MSNVYIISTALTAGTLPVAETFLSALESELCKYAGVTKLETDSVVRMAEPERGDVVIVFNRPDKIYQTHVQHLLTKARVKHATILPVAVTAAHRSPPPQSQDTQSFDVVEELRQRNLEPHQVAVVATVFAREALSKLKPTLASASMHLFLSYRRLDGEEIAYAFHQKLVSSAQTAFRDLFDIKVGEDSQEVIEAHVRNCDAVIFLDTPKSGTSPWIEKELRTALSLQLPIVWVRIGPEEQRAPLSVRPLGTPHFVYPELNVADGEILSTEAEGIVHKAFDIHHHDYVDRLLDEWARLEDIAKRSELALQAVDRHRMIYTLLLPRGTSRYKQRPMTHLLQLFGRMPTAADVSRFAGCAKEVGYEPHPQHGPYYDSAILLAAIPSRPNPSLDQCGVHTDSIGDYVMEIEKVVSPTKIRPKRLVISGAFPDCEPEFQQNVTNAVHAAASAALTAGFGISFGAHPTFQFMIFDLAKRLRPNDYKAAVRMYISRFFATQQAIDELAQNAEVIPIDPIDQSRAASLRAMRQAMLNDSEASAVLAIGGKTARGGHSPGVDEEIDIARHAGLRVYLLGSVGGRTGELTVSMPIAERMAFNGLSESQTEEFGTSLDYSRLAGMIIDSSF